MSIEDQNVNVLKSTLKMLIEKLLLKSLQFSSKQRGEQELRGELEEIVKDISNQYTTFTIAPDNKYINTKLRCQHAFQMRLLLDAIEKVGLQRQSTINIVDIGDSSGTHLTYLNSLAAARSFDVNSLSVNLDPVAVDKVKALGLDAVLCRAEEFHKLENGFVPDLFILFETLEHFFDPISFLRAMAVESPCEHIVLTVPFVKFSRVGMSHIRDGSSRTVMAENTHIFELCPEDWSLIFSFSGWEIIHEEKYTQYPKYHILSWTKCLWRKYDFDGFYGVVLKKHMATSDRYLSW